LGDRASSGNARSAGPQLRSSSRRSVFSLPEGILARERDSRASAQEALQQRRRGSRLAAAVLLAVRAEEGVEEVVEEVEEGLVHAP
jgi:hypothetical protein